MFIGREKELSQLEEAYYAEGCKFFVIHGARGTGKTTLIEEFCRGKNAVIFSPVFGDMKANLSIFSGIVLRHFADMNHHPFQYWEDVLKYTPGKISVS